MDIKDINGLIQLINSSDLAYFEVTSKDLTIKMDKSLTRTISDNKNVESGGNLINNTVTIDNIQSEESYDDLNIEFINSPMVGTFYASPSPDNDNFVSIGDEVSVGTVLCIIEAMKLMNEIESEVSGEVVDILVENGDVVEFGQPIFKIRRC